MSNSCKLLFTLYAIYFVGEVVVLVSQKSKTPRGRVILHGELLYMCKEIISEFESFMYLVDEIVTRKNF